MGRCRGSKKSCFFVTSQHRRSFFIFSCNSTGLLLNFNIKYVVPNQIFNFFQVEPLSPALEASLVFSQLEFSLKKQLFHDVSRLVYIVSLEGLILHPSIPSHSRVAWVMNFRRHLAPRQDQAKTAREQVYPCGIFPSTEHSCRSKSCPTQRRFNFSHPTPEIA